MSTQERKEGICGQPCIAAIIASALVVAVLIHSPSFSDTDPQVDAAQQAEAQQAKAKISKQKKAERFVAELVNAQPSR
ncbi:hypothetical protein [Niveispirillum sp. KHB5.9]|uniref:hypothetical protein n=1 Tax=Niveispirillum sp. KHB5.9 TaxID=3400269 RepID=UPI003A84602E